MASFKDPRLNIAFLKQESPPPEPTPPPMAAPLVPQMQMDPTRRQSFNTRDVNMTGTYQPTHAMPGPSPSPVPHYPHQFQGAPGVRPSPVSAPIVPVPQFSMQPMGAVPMAPMPQPPAPLYSPHAYSHQQQFTPGPPTPGVHHAVPSPMPVAYNQVPRHVPSPAMMGTPSRTPMAPAANVNSLPHANAQQQYSNQYNAPRSHEVYRLMDPATEASIPAEVREQFQRDDEGRILWFTAAGRDRAPNGVAPEYAGLGHSISHLANIGDIREERAMKRKERDEAVAREEAAKKVARSREADEELARAREEAKNSALGRTMLAFAEQMDAGTRVVEEGLGNWREEKRLWDEEKRARKAAGEKL